jgi:GTP cyclohydrolase IA
MRSSPVPRVLHEPAKIDLGAAERAAGQFLTALGISLDSESLRDTPGRMARAYAELFTPRPFDLTTFPNDEDYNELVLARSIPVRSVCDTTCCRSWVSPMSATCPVTGFWVCRSWLG